MAEPQVSIGKGRLQIILKGEQRYRSGRMGKSKVLILARALLLLLAPIVIILGGARLIGWF